MAYWGKVLLVDDDPNVLELVKLYGEREGFEVIGIDHGDLALPAFDRENPDVVILDIMLPGKDGLTLCRELRAIRMVPIIMLTAKGKKQTGFWGWKWGPMTMWPNPSAPGNWWPGSRRSSAGARPWTRTRNGG